MRVVVVDDFEPWRRFISSTLESKPEYAIVCEAADGLEAVQKAEDLKPDLILLDLGLPGLGGIEVAKRISERAPDSKILFVSENRSWDVVQEALATGAGGYFVKSDGAKELLRAMRAVLLGKQFVSNTLTRHLLVAMMLVHL